MVVFRNKQFCTIQIQRAITSAIGHTIASDEKINSMSLRVKTNHVYNGSIALLRG